MNKKDRYDTIEGLAGTLHHLREREREWARGREWKMSVLGNMQARFKKGQTSLVQGNKAQAVLLGIDKNRRYLLQFIIRVSLFTSLWVSQ